MYLSHYPFVSLVIPCYNEVERISQLENGLKHFIAEWCGKFEVIIINDGSKDDTLNALHSNTLITNLQKEGKAKIIDSENEGKGGALQKGVQIANGDFILTLDADMATLPLELILWQRATALTFEGTHICIANRTDKKSVLQLISTRRSQGNIFNKIVKKSTGLLIDDTQCGFKLYPKVMGKKLFENLQTKGWAHDVEILIKAKKMNYPVLQMPITWIEKDASKVNMLTDSFKMIWDVLKMRFFLKV